MSDLPIEAEAHIMAEHLRKTTATDNKNYVEYRCPPPCNALLAKYKDTSPVPYGFEIKCHRKIRGQRNWCRAMNYRGNVVMSEPVEFRCRAVDKKRSDKMEREIICNKLLAKVIPGTILEIECPRCGALQSSEHLIPKPEEHKDE